jgi:hypothetical protein
MGSSLRLAIGMADGEQITRSETDQRELLVSKLNAMLTT